MSSSTTIDKKKEEKNQNNNSSESTPTADYASFYSNVTYTVISLLASICFACGFLYICKLSNTNLLIDNLELAPFGDKCRDYENGNNTVDLNITKTYGENGGILGRLGLGWVLGNDAEIFSTKVDFKPIDLDSYIIFNYLKKMVDKTDWKKDEKCGTANMDVNKLSEAGINANTGFSFMIRFVYNIVSSTFTTNMFLFNTVFRFLNEWIPEGFIFILFVLLGGSIFGTLITINFFVVVFYFFWYFTNNYESRYCIDGKTGWVFDWNNLLYFFTLPNLMSLLLLFFGFGFIFCISIFTSIYSLIAPLFITGEIIINTDKKGGGGGDIPSSKPYNFLDFIKNMFKYKHQLIILLFIYHLFGTVIQTLGTTFLLSLIVVILILLYMTNYFDSYSNIKSDTNLTPGLFQSTKIPLNTAMNGCFDKIDKTQQNQLVVKSQPNVTETPTSALETVVESAETPGKNLTETPSENLTETPGETTAALESDKASPVTAVESVENPTEILTTIPESAEETETIVESLDNALKSHDDSTKGGGNYKKSGNNVKSISYYKNA